MDDQIITPLDVAIQILSRQDTDYTLHFSKYNIAKPGSQYQQPREVVPVERRDFGIPWINHQINSLTDYQELTWNSNIKTSNMEYHVPMIDFEVGIDNDLLKYALNNLTKELDLQELWCFKSGRSYHAYGLPLLSLQDWYSYLGKLLTLPSIFPAIDTRWIGHSLRRGYSALRWSHKTTRYRQLPTFYHYEKIIGG